MARTERLEVLLRRLADRPGMTAGELARDLGTSNRSLFRDLAYLRERGYPIESSRGRGGGLRLHPNWGLSRVLLAADEGVALLLGLAIVEALGLPLFGAALGRGRRKIVHAFPALERRRLAPLRERILVGPAASAAVRASWQPPNPANMRRAESAFVQARVVRADYRRQDGSVSRREIEPHALLVNWPAWYFLAFDRERAGARTFRLDRFGPLEPTAATFRPRPRGLLADAGGIERISHDRLSV